MACDLFLFVLAEDAEKVHCAQTRGWQGWRSCVGRCCRPPQPPTDDRGTQSAALIKYSPLFFKMDELTSVCSCHSNTSLFQAVAICGVKRSSPPWRLCSTMITCQSIPGAALATLPSAGSFFFLQLVFSIYSTLNTVSLLSQRGRKTGCNINHSTASRRNRTLFYCCFFSIPIRRSSKVQDESSSDQVKNI